MKSQTAGKVECDVKDLNLAADGKLRIEWVSRRMPVLASIRERFRKKKPLKGLKVACCLHVTTETAFLVMTLKEGGALPYLCASNPLSTQDDVAAALVEGWKIPVFAIKNENKRTYYHHLQKVVESKPEITMDDGADLTSTLHSDRRDLLSQVIGGTEETTTGVLRLRSLEEKKLLEYPIVAVNDADTKHFFDNRYGTGQSTIDGILRATNVLLAGGTFVVAGYGWCGRGLAERARGMGAHVIVTEVDPLRALQAVMDGFQVMTMDEAALRGDIFVTVTGNTSVLSEGHFLRMKDGAIIANSGHFNVEIDIPALEKISRRKRRMREFVTEYLVGGKKRIYLLAEGRLINLASAEGHPATVMDMSFANQALSVEYLAERGRSLEKKVYPVPPEIDREIARLKLEALGVKIDSLSEKQEKYLSSWEFGT